MASTIKVDKIAQSSGTPEFTIPTADGTAGQFLKTDGSGVLAFDTVTTNPLALTGSTNTWIPTITAADALTGTANFTYDGNILDVKNSGTASSIKLYCENANAHAQEIKAAPHAGSSAWTLTLPGAAPTVSGQVLSATTAGVASWVADAGGLFSDYAIICDQKTAGSTGGTFTSGAWRTRDLNTEIADPSGIVAIASEQFTLGAGTYLIKWSAPACQVQEHQTRLYDVTGAAVIISGSSENAENNAVGYVATQNQVTIKSIGFARVTPSGDNIYRIEHRSAVTKSSFGFGIAGNFSELERYTMVEIYKEA